MSENNYYNQQYEKGTKMLSPISGRMITVGSVSWKKLAKLNLVNPTMKKSTNKTEPIKINTRKESNPIPIPLNRTKSVRKPKKKYVKQKSLVFIKQNFSIVTYDLFKNTKKDLAET